MNVHDDIIHTISLQIENFNDLIHFCYLNQNNKRVCSQNIFWVNIFNEWGLTLPLKYPSTLNDWIKEFYAKYHTNQILYDLINANYKNLAVKSSALFTMYTFKVVYGQLEDVIELLQLSLIETKNYNTFLYMAQMHSQNNISDIKTITIKYFYKGSLQGTYEIVIELMKTSLNKAYKPVIHFNMISQSKINLFLYYCLYNHVI